MGCWRVTARFRLYRKLVIVSRSRFYCEQSATSSIRTVKMSTIKGNSQKDEVVNRVFVSRMLPDNAMSLLTSSRHNVTTWNESDSPIPRQDLLTQIRGVDAVVCLLTERIDKEFLNAAGANLKVVSTMSVGYDHIDAEELKKRKIRLGNTPDVLTDATAELTVALLLMTTRRLLEASDEAKSGGWGTWSPTWMCGTSLKGSVVGVVGMGRIGLAVARLLQPFGVRQILYSGTSEKPSVSKEINGCYVTFENLLEESDIVLACCSLNSNTAGLFDSEAFDRMKNTAIFINTSRGGVVNQDDMVDALTAGTIKAAGLDVTTPEPLPVDHKLFQLPNCVLLPHVGSAEMKTRNDMATLAVRNVLAALDEAAMPAEVLLESL